MNTATRKRRHVPRSRFLLLLPPIAVMTLIFVLSAQTDETTNRAVWEVLVRKLAHVTEYAALTYTWWRAFAGIRPSAALSSTLAGAASVSLLYACTDELHQTFVSGRHGTPIDVLVDTIGIGLVCALAVRAQARSRRRTVGPSRARAA